MRALVIIVLLALVGCSNNSASALRSATYPPSFDYVKKGDLRTAMWKLAADVRAIDDVLREPTISDGARLEVVEALRRMEATSAGIAKGEVTNHPNLDRYLHIFVQDVTGARKAVEAEPANYFLAGSISGGCTYCHR